MTKIKLAINSYNALLNFNPLYCADMMERGLSDDTKKKFDKSNLHLWVIAMLVKDTVDESSGNVSVIDQIMVGKLHNLDLMNRLIDENPYR